MNDFNKWLEHYKATHGPVLDLKKMEASVMQWQFNQLPMDKRYQAARNILSEAALNFETTK